MDTVSAKARRTKNYEIDLEMQPFWLEEYHNLPAHLRTPVDIDREAEMLACRLPDFEDITKWALATKEVLKITVTDLDVGIVFVWELNDEVKTYREKVMGEIAARFCGYPAHQRGE